MELKASFQETIAEKQREFESPMDREGHTGSVSATVNEFNS